MTDFFYHFHVNTENYIWVAWDILENVMKRSSMISFYLVCRMREEAVGWIWYVYMRVDRGNQAPSIGILVKASSIGLERKREVVDFCTLLFG